MRRIPSKGTKPELYVRTLLHKLGYRFRLNGKTNKRKLKKGILPGKPDIVLAKYNAVIFVNGCFWHGHTNCKKAHLPKTNTDYWKRKIQKNMQRDKKVNDELCKMGYKILTIWECQIEDKSVNISNIVTNFLEGGGNLDE